jgi:flagellar protein FlaJ
VKKMKKKKKSKGIKEIIKPTYIPPIIGTVLILIGIVFYQYGGVMLSLISLGAIVAVAPYALLLYFEYVKIKAIEDQLPVFLLDLAESQKVGLTLHESLRQASKTDYGKLSPEIKKVYNQLSWGIGVQEVFRNFAKRMKKSKLTSRVVSIINETYISGGDIGRTMEATASDITAIKEAEKERRAVTSQHTFIMYAIYFIFIGIVIGLSQTLIPMLNIGNEASTAGGIGGIFSFSDPCEACVDNPSIYCINCPLFSMLCSVFGFEQGGSCYYNALFILMAVVQGIFSGLVAGEIGEGSVLAGIKHSVIMTVIGVITLVVILSIM